jgi:DNA-binding LacI/PurR family transcriptional regulator
MKMDTMIGEARYKYEEIADRIRRKIVTGDYPIGERIPTIRDLATAYGVNPQTVNKATAYLASLGYLVSRQGAGSVAAMPRSTSQARLVPMLVDRRRSELLRELDSVFAYHCKDIYLIYMLASGEDDYRTEFIVYDETDSVVNDAFRAAVGEAAGFVVQGDLPGCYLDQLGESGVPTALINRGLSEKRPQNVFSLLYSQNALDQMINYVISMGHDRLLFVLSDQFEKGSVYNRRLSRVEEIARSWNPGRSIVVDTLTFSPDRMPDPTVESRLSDGFTCAIGYNDISALAFYAQVHALGLTIPGDISVVGFDDILAAQLAGPPLTTIRVDRAAMVRSALAMIRDYPGRGTRDATVLVDTQIVLRKSVSPPRS